MTPKKLTRAAIYTRVSFVKKKDLEKKGLDEEDLRVLSSVERQEARARELCEQRGWEIVETFVDSSVSAYKARGGKTAWARMLQAISEGQVEIVVAWANDRLTRSARGQLDLMEALREVGGKIVTVKDGESNPNTAAGRLVMNTLANVAEFESARKAERIEEWAEDRARVGHAKSGGRRPYGYEWSEKKHTFAILPEEAVVIRRIAKDLLHGRSLVSTVHGLNVDGIRTANGASWNARGAKRMVLSPTVAGIRVHERTGTVVKGDWKPIITQTQHELLTALFNDPTRPRRGGGPTERKRLLGGLLVCGKCGQKLYGDGPSGYSCKGRANGACGNIRIAAAGLEDHVWARAVERIKELERKGALSPLPAEEDEVAETLVEERLGLMQRRDELAGKYAEEILDERQLTVGTAKIDERVRAIDQQLAASVRSKAIPDPEDRVFFVPVPRPDRNYSAILEPKELLERSELLKALIERIEVGPASGRGVRFEPDRLKISWRKSGHLRFPEMG